MSSNDGASQRLSEIIESIVTSGMQRMDDTKMKELKKICRLSDEFVEQAFNLLMHQLNQNHSEIRVASLNIVQELFSRSHCFRNLVASEFQEFTKLVLDINPEKALPPPAAAAKQLKLSATKCIKEWDNVYGEAYKKLRIGYNYLKKTKMVDFEDSEARTVQERNRIATRETKLNAMKKAKLDSLLGELNAEEIEMSDCITQMQNGLSLLVPDEIFSIPHCEAELEAGDDLRAHGLTGTSANSNFNLVIEVQPLKIQVNDDNREIIQCLRDQYRLLNSRFLPSTLKWNIIAAKLGADEHTQKRILDMKIQLETLIQKYLQLNLPQGKIDENEEDSSESDLETVAELDDRDEASFFKFLVDDDEPGPSGYVPSLRRRALPESKLPVDIESYEASQSSQPLPTFSVNPVESYWVQDLDTESGAASAASLLTQPVALSETFKPVKWVCRAPMSNGKLCPRKDRIKCPFHGPIVARDEQGQPKDPSSVKLPARNNTVPDWQEPSLLADIKAATGVDLTMPVKGKRVKKSQHPNLTDIKKLKNTPRARLEKKVLKRSVVKKVASTMDSADAKHMKGKFGDQWNYT